MSSFGACRHTPSWLCTAARSTPRTHRLQAFAVCCPSSGARTEVQAEVCGQAGGLDGSPRRVDLATVCCLRACHRSVLTCDGTARCVAPSRSGYYHHHFYTPFRRAGVSRGAQASGKSSEVGHYIRLAVQRGRIAQHWARASRPAIFIATFSSSAPNHNQLQPTESVFGNLLTSLCCACVCVLQEQRVERFAGF